MSRRKQARPRSYKSEIDENLAEPTCLSTNYDTAEKHVHSVDDAKSNIMVSLLSDDNNTVSDGNEANHRVRNESKTVDIAEDACAGDECNILDTARDDDSFPFVIGESPTFPYACYSCNKAFQRRGQLQKHEQVHSSEWQFDCPYCGKKFRHKRSRDRHRKQHSSSRKYRCIKCDAAFARSDHLKVHYRTHDQFKPYKCTMCNRSYSTPLSLTIHVSQHNDYKNSRSNMYRCGFCRVTYEHVKELTQHVQVAHKGSNVPVKLNHVNPDEPIDVDMTPVDPADWQKCTECTSMFPTSTQLEDHIAAEHTAAAGPSPGHDGTNIKEYIIEETVDIKTEPERVTEEEKDGGGEVSPEKLMNDSFLAASLHVCPYCFQSNFSSLESLEVHMQSVHSAKPRDIYTCNHCNAPYQNLYSLHEHMRVVHKNMPSLDIKYPCSMCGECFSSLEDLAIHKEASHNSLIQKSPGRSPSESVISFSKLSSPGYNRCDLLDGFAAAAKRQKLSPPGAVKPKHPGDRCRDICFRCNSSFSDSSAYIEHMRQHFNETAKQGETYTGDHKCVHCGKGFMSEKLLETHVYLHFLVIVNKYLCLACTKAFSKPDELQRHLLDMHAQQLYRCILCAEIFESKVNMQVHFAVKHSNERKLYKCVECCKMFENEEPFKNHVQTYHSTVTSLTPSIRCIFCQQCFTNDFDLQCHITTHQKTFQCTLCSESFHVEFLRDKHLQDVHADIKPDPDASPDPNRGLLKTEGYGASRLFDRRFTCNICDESFRDFSTLQKHKLTKHNQHVDQISSCFDHLTTQPVPTDTSSSFAEGIPDSCPFCSQTFRSRTEMDKHMKIHVNGDTAKCTICDEVFHDTAKLAEHKLQHCKISQGNCCVECKESLISEEDFYTHVQEHGSITSSLMQCIICRQSLASVTELQMHGKFHFGKSPTTYACSVCLKQFTDAESLTARVCGDRGIVYTCLVCSLKNDRVAADFFCPDCPMVLPTNDALKAHRLTTHSTAKNFQCIKCQESFNSEYEIKLHVASHMLHEGNTNVCNLCKDSFDSPAKLQLHLIEHSFADGSEMPCHVCGTSYTSPARIQSHALTHGVAGRKYKCRDCSQAFFFSAELENHIRDEHMLPDENLVKRIILPDRPKRSPGGKKTPASKAVDNCDVCHKTFATLSALISHKKIHENTGCEDMTCSLCQETFNTITELQQHTMNEHKTSHHAIQVDHQTFRCPECDKEFPKLSSLQGHSHIHKTGKKYSCPLCRKVFTLASNLKIHLQCHTSDKPYSCNICSKTFSRKENMLTHVKTHTESKPFTCHVCDKSFAKNTHLRDHIRVHFAQDPTNMTLSNIALGTSSPSTYDDPSPTEDCIPSQNGGHENGPVFPTALTVCDDTDGPTS